MKTNEHKPMANCTNNKPF